MFKCQNCGKEVYDVAGDGFCLACSFIDDEDGHQLYSLHNDYYFCDYCDERLITDNLPVEDWYCPNCGKADLST